MAQLLVYLVEALADPSVLAEQHAVVAEQHDERVVHQAEVREPVEEVAQPGVDERDLGGVELAHAAQDPRRQPQRRVLGRGGGERLERLDRRVRWPVQVPEAARRVPRLVSVEGVDHERKRLARARPLDPVHAVPEHPRRQVVLLGAVARVRGQVGGQARLCARPSQRPRQVARHLGLGRLALRLEAQRRLPVHQLDAVEGAAEAPVHAEQEVRVVRHVAGRPALLAQDLGPGLAVAADGLPARLRGQLLDGPPAAERKGAAAGHDRPPRGDGRHALRVGAREAKPLLGDLVHRRRARSRPVDVVGPQAVHHHDHHVHRARRCGLALEGRLARGLVVVVAAGRPEQRDPRGAGAAGLDQAPACEVVAQVASGLRRKYGRGSASENRAWACTRAQQMRRRPLLPAP